jgi:arylsulfatase A-like enzyme
MRRWIVIALVIAVTAQAERLPNIVFIVADDLGWADTSPYGSTFHETPNIQRLADSGMRFLNAHTTSPVCSPGRASLMTGLYAERLGMTQPACHIPLESLKATVAKRTHPWIKAVSPKSTTRLDTTFMTYAKVFQKNGYHTAHYGKWHLGPEPYSPLEHGFDVDVPHTKAHGPIGSYFGPKKYSDTFFLEKGEHLEDRMGDEAVAFIEENKDRPFFLNYWSFSVHTPPFTKKELLDKYRAKAAKLPAGAKQRNPLYAGMIETFDDNVGKLLDAIKAAGIEKETIVVLFSDNGGTVQSGYTEKAYWGNGTKEEILDIPLTSNYPKRASKGTIYDGGTASPCIVRWPGTVKKGSVSEAYLSGADWFPTLVEMAGLSMPAGLEIDGVSQVPVLKGKKESVRDTLYGYWPNYIERLDTSPAAWIQKDGYKLIRYFFAGEDQADVFELYNLKKDESEQRNLASQMPERVQQLNGWLTKHFEETQAVIPVANPNYDSAAAKPDRK